MYYNTLTKYISYKKCYKLRQNFLMYWFTQEYIV
jgi:hypothetical protein